MPFDPHLDRRRRVISTILAVVPWLSMGCKDELGPERFATTTVRGQVVVGAQPVGGGFIEIHPAPGTRGNLRVGSIRADGTFQLERVPVGSVLIGLSQLPVGPIPSVLGPVDPRQFGIQGQLFDPIRRTIPPDDPTRLPPIDLIKEAARPRRNPNGRRKKRPNRSGGGTITRPTRLDGPRADPNDHSPIRTPQTLTIRVMHRDAEGTLHLDCPIDQVPSLMNQPDATVWIDVEDLDSAHNGEVEAFFRDLLHFHPLAIEDALKDVHIPRIDDWGNYLYLVVDTIDFHPATDELQLHELDLFLGANWLVTYHHEPIEVIARHHRQIEREGEDRLRQGAGHLLHRLLDDLVDQFLPAIEHLDTAIDQAQDEVFDHATPATLRRIFHIKGCALRLQRVVSPMREVLNRLARDPYPQIRAEHRVYFRDVYDHLVRVHDIVESLRDLIAGALDTYLSIVSNRTNDIMKVLTLLNVMFLPMTFIVGFFGMNFFGETLMFREPELPRRLIFGLTVGLMVLAPLGMWAVARSRGWF